MYSDFVELKKLLKGVSRTFYLGIVFLRKPLDVYILITYLLCRIADTIEDDPKINIDKKRKYLTKFYNLVCTTYSSITDEDYKFFNFLTPTKNEKIVLDRIDTILKTFSSFPSPIQNVIKKHLKIMTDGMSKYAIDSTSDFIVINDLKDLEEYCYYVAGVVGEMLTGIFLEEIKFSKFTNQQLNNLGIDCGLGLQFVNVVKDVYTDNQRGWHYYPKSLMNKYKISHEELFTKDKREDTKKVISEMLQISQQKLRDGLEYTLAIPRNEFTVRSFTFWPIILALKSLREISLHIDDMMDGKKIKITRKEVYKSIFYSMIFISSNFLTKLYYNHIKKQIKYYH